MSNLKRNYIRHYLVIILLTFISGTIIGDDSAKKNVSDSVFLNEYIKTNGLGNAILFESSNIKQFWTDKSIVNKGNIIIRLNKEKNYYESLLYKLQLVNVSEYDEIAKPTDIATTVTTSATISNNCPFLFPSIFNSSYFLYL